MKTKTIYPTQLHRSWILLAVSFLFSLQVFSQAPNWLWSKSIGGVTNDYGYSITADASGNVYTTGHFIGTVDFDPGGGVFNLTSDSGSADIFISKLDTSGNFVWAKQIGGAGFDEGSSIAIDTSGNVYTTGRFEGTVDFDPGTGVFNLSVSTGYHIFISKLNSSGNFVWAKRMDGYGQGYAIALDVSGNVYTTGFFGGVVDFDPNGGGYYLSVVGGADIFISKLSSFGNFVWAKAMGSINADEGHSIALDASGNVYTTGLFQLTVDFDPGPGIFNLTSVGGYDIFISKLNSSGNFLWAKAMGGISTEGGASIALDASGNVYTTGPFQDTADFDPGAGIFNLVAASAFWRDIFISKLDSSGNFVWAKAMGGTTNDGGSSIALDASGNVYTTGYFSGIADFDPDPGTGVFNLAAAGNGDIFISKLNSLGNFVWAKAVGGVSDDQGNSITLDASGNISITGVFRSPSVTFGFTPLTNADNIGNTADIFIAKLDTAMTIGINEAANSGNSILVFPNPTAGQLSVNTAHLLGKTETEIYNTLGEKVYEQKIISPETEINLSNQPAGIYFVRMRNNKQILTQKIIIQK